MGHYSYKILSPMVQLLLLSNVMDILDGGSINIQNINWVGAQRR